MRIPASYLFLPLLPLLAVQQGQQAFGQSLPKGIKFTPGPVNRLSLPGNTSLYSGPAQRILLTHLRRDVATATEQFPASTFIVPAAESKQLSDGPKLWSLFRQTRFHDYAQRTTKWPLATTPPQRETVKEGDTLSAGPIQIQVWDTPGFSPGSVTYLFEAGGKRIAATGDLIYQGGRLLDLYSLQDAIPETKTRGYHGYAARAGQLITSLRRIRTWKPDLIVPARGPLLQQPVADIDKLIARLEAILQSHFATDALRWYWGEESWRTRGAAALGQPTSSASLSPPMPMGTEVALPSWVLALQNSRLLLTPAGQALLLDAGHPKIAEMLEELHAAGRFKTLEGIWVTHYHDDHTDFVNKVAKRWNAPVHYSASIANIIEAPAEYRMPAQTHLPAKGTAHADKEQWQWRGMQFTSFHFPGQTLYHGGLLVENSAAPEKLFFIGDSFTPSGLDDYCLLNRNLTGENEGYLYCLRLVDTLRAKHGEKLWLINQHVAPMFQYDEARITRMQNELRKRRELLQALTPLPGANFAVDEAWARLSPYALSAKVGPSPVALTITNHSDKPQTFQIVWHAPKGWKLTGAEQRLQLAAGATGQARATIQAEPGASLALLTVDIRFAGLTLSRWAEALLETEE